MKNEEELLRTWLSSAAQMHIAHHLAAARYSKYQKFLGSFSVVLSTLVTSSLFIAIKNAAETNNDQSSILVIGLISLFASVVAGIHSFLRLDQKINDHYKGAVSFQYLRRLIEEELVFCRLGKAKNNYEFIRDTWRVALENALPLPQDLYQKAGNQFQKEYDQATK